MKHAFLIAFAAAGAMLCHCDAGAQTPAAHMAAVPAKSDKHVSQLYDLMKAAHAPNAPPLAHAALLEKVKAISADHAKEVGADPAEMEKHAMAALQGVAMASQKDPHVMDSLDTFYAAMTAEPPAGPPHH